ncbi:MAG: hypothetical protein ABSG65_21620, partial [Bryobacteraceae bacterium]
FPLRPGSSPLILFPFFPFNAPEARSKNFGPTDHSTPFSPTASKQCQPRPAPLIFTQPHAILTSDQEITTLSIGFPHSPQGVMPEPPKLFDIFNRSQATRTHFTVRTQADPLFSTSVFQQERTIAYQVLPRPDTTPTPSPGTQSVPK